MGVKVYVIPLSQQNFAGDLVHGTVDLQVEAAHYEGSLADKLTLRLVGKASTLVCRKANIQQIIREEQEIISHEVQLTTFGGKATRGRHSYPFSLALPPGLPPTMKETDQGGGRCEIKYTLEARLHRPGCLNFDVKGKTELVVFSMPNKTPPTPVTMGPDTRRVKKCWCFPGGSISIGFEADRSVVGRNEVMSIVVVACNNSSSNVNDLEIEIKQETRWYARSHGDLRKRTIASVKIPGSQLGELQRAPEKGHERGRSQAAIADAAQRDLQDMLKAEAGTKYELVVPSNCHTSTQTSLIVVRHALVVELKTPSCITSPEVWMPLRVQQNVGQGATEEPTLYAAAFEGGSIGDSTSLSLHYSSTTTGCTRSMSDPVSPETKLSSPFS